jgi:hypothetical protein
MRPAVCVNCSSAKARIVVEVAFFALMGTAKKRTPDDEMAERLVRFSTIRVPLPKGLA